MKIKNFTIALFCLSLVWGCSKVDDITDQLQKPTAKFTADITSGEAPLTVTFDGSSSSAGIGQSIKTYAWFFGDGEIGNGKTVDHIYNSEGRFTVKLIITDSAGVSVDSVKTGFIIVGSGANKKPVAEFSTSSKSGEAPFLVSFDGSFSNDDDGDIKEYSWDFGDGSTAGAGVDVNHLYTDAGLYNVKLTVTDASGSTDSIIRNSHVIVSSKGINSDEICAKAMVNCGIVADGDGGYVSCGDPGTGEVCVSNRIEPQAATDKIENGGFATPADGVFLHAPFQNALTDISANNHEITMSETDTGEWVSRVDMFNKQIIINLHKGLSDQYTISFKMMPFHENQSQKILESDAFLIEESDGAIKATVYENDGNNTIIENSASQLNTFTGNHFVLAAGGNQLVSYLNGRKVEVNSGNPAALDRQIAIDFYNGKIWDLRIYNRQLTETEILDLAGLHADQRFAADRHKGYPNYKAGVYVREWWPENFEDADYEDGNDRYECSDDELNHYIKYQDMVYERNILETGMYTQGSLFDYLVNGSGKDLMLSSGIRKTFVRKFSSQNLMTYKNSQYWLHENFHSFQGKLKGYQGFSAGKFFLECTASWGADSITSGSVDSLQGLYTFDTHLPLWINQSHEIESSIYVPGETPATTNGGHQYGAYIFISYITKNIVSDKLVGDVYNDNRTGEPARVIHELLKKAGYSMEEVFIDFASRLPTWDMSYGDLYTESEAASMNRYKTKILSTDHKYTSVYDGNGTGNTWTDIKDRYNPGSWGFNAYKVNADSGNYTIALKTDTSNPDYSDFRARAVVYNEVTGKRTYYPFDVASPGQDSEISLNVNTGEQLLFIVATTPDIFSDIETYTYQYKIYRK